MALPHGPAISVAASAVSFWTASLFGIPVGTIALGIVASLCGMLGRFGFDMQQGIETQQRSKMAMAAGWVGAGAIGAPFITLAWLLLLKAAGVQSDAVTGIGLLSLGFSGPKGVTWLMTMTASVVQKALPKAPAPPEAPKP